MLVFLSQKEKDRIEAERQSQCKEFQQIRCRVIAYLRISVNFVVICSTQTHVIVDASFNCRQRLENSVSSKTAELTKKEQSRWQLSEQVQQLVQKQKRIETQLEAQQVSVCMLSACG